MSKEKIAYFIGSTSISGAEKRLLYTASGVSKNLGVKIDVIIQKSVFENLASNDLLKTDSFEGINLKVVPEWNFNNLFFQKFSYLLLNSLYVFAFTIFRCKKLHVALYNKKVVPIFIILKIIFRKKIYYEVTSPDLAIKPLTIRIANRRSLYDKMIAVSPNVAKILQNSCKNKPELYLRKFPYVDHIKESNEYKLSEKENRVVFAHRLIKRKNPELAVEAFTKLAYKYSDWSFEIFGSGHMEEKIEKLIQKKSLDNLLFQGYHNGIIEVLANSKIFVSLIYPDNYPSQSVFEAFQMGNVVVFSDTGDSRKYFFDEQVSRCTDLNIESVVNAINYFIINYDTIESPAKAINFIEQNYSKNKYIDDTVNIYRD